jgi:hypothetical protein
LAWNDIERVVEPVVMTPLRRRGGFVPGRLERVCFRAHLVPAAAQRGHHHRLDDALDVVAPRVVGAELGALAGVERALEEGAEDRRLDTPPVERGRRGQPAQLFPLQRHDVDRSEKAAVESGDPLQVERAAVAHRFQEGLHLSRELVRVPGAEVKELGEDAFGQQADVFGKEAEEELDEEVRGTLRLDAAGVEGAGQRAEAGRGLFGHGLDGDIRFQAVGIAKDTAQDVEIFGLIELVDREGVLALGGAGEVGVDFEALQVGDDEDRRVAEILAVLEELGVGRVEVGPVALVLPGEVVFPPDVGEPLSTLGLPRALLEGVERAVLVGFGGGRHAEQAAEIEEVLLGGAALGQGAVAPLGLELLRRHGGGRNRHPDPLVSYPSSATRVDKG